MSVRKMKRNLKADLELSNKIRALDGFETDDFMEFVEVERIALEYAANVREGWPHAIERALEAEALARELAEVLLLYEKWEADLLMDNSLWQSASGLPFITQEVWDELVAVQTERNKALHKVKEVLGDE